MPTYVCLRGKSTNAKRNSNNDKIEKSEHAFVLPSSHLALLALLSTSSCIHHMDRKSIAEAHAE